MKTLKEAERELIHEAVKIYSGKPGWKKEAAEALGIATKTFYALLRSHGLGEHIRTQAKRRAASAHLRGTDVPSDETDRGVNTEARTAVR